MKGTMGAGARAPRLLLDHQGPPRGVGAAGRVRAEPPQGAPPGGADLAHRPRLHAHALAARLAAQPARVRGGRHPVRAHPARAPRRVARPARRCSTRTLAALARRPERAGARSTTRSSATGCSACSPATSSTRASSPRVRTPWSSSRRSPVASSGRSAREIVAVTVERADRRRLAPTSATATDAS